MSKQILCLELLGHIRIFDDYEGEEIVSLENALLHFEFLNYVFSCLLADNIFRLMSFVESVVLQTLCVFVIECFLVAKVVFPAGCGVRQVLVVG